MLAPARPTLRPSAARRSLGAALLLAAAGCGGDSVTSPAAGGFLDGASSDRQIGVVVNSLGRSLTLFQVGSPATTRTIPLGASSTVTPIGLSLRGRRAAVPLGDAASVALVDLAADSVTRFFTFASGNATGSAWVDDSTVLAANTLGGYVGRFRTGQAAGAITSTVALAPSPTAIVVAGGRALVVSSNLDANYAPIGDGVVTAVDPATMTVLGSVQTGGTNATDAALGPDGKLYVVNTGDYVSPGSLTIIDPSTLAAEATIPGMGVGPGAITVDANGLAYVSSFSYGTIVWNTRTRQFVRDASNPVCAPIGSTGKCRGATAAGVTANGTLYQAFFGGAVQGLAPQLFVYRPGTFALADSVAAGDGPSSVAIRTF